MRLKNLLPLLLLPAMLQNGYRAIAQVKPTQIKTGKAVKNTSVEGITEYQFPNGLKVLLFPDPSKPTITVNITYLVGSRMEGYGETGMAHLLEHMMFKGSKGHRKIPAELTAHGASPNGTTSYDRTNYFETFSATDENLNWGLTLEADRMVNSFVADSDLKSEFSVVRNEFESGENSPSNVLMERVLSTAYLWHNYGKSTIGSKEDIEKVPIKNLQTFYKKYYQPDNAVLLVAGKIDEQKTLQLVEKYFAGIPKPSRHIDPTYTVEPAQDGERNVTLNRVGDVQGVACAYHIVAGSDADYPAFDILNEVLTNQPNGRLYQNMVKTEKASVVWSWDAAMKDPGFLFIYADVLKDKSLEKAKDAMLNTIDEFAKKPVTADEVARAKSKIMKDFEETYRNTEYIGLTLSEYIAQGDWRLAFLYRDNLKNVTADDVNRIIKKYLIASNRTTGEFIPTTDPVRVVPPAAPDVAAIVKNYKGQEALAKAEAFDASPANIEKRTMRGTIAGGAKYAMLVKTTRGNTVEATISLRLGSEKDLENKATAASMTASMLKRGTKNKTMAQINEALDKLSSSIYVFGYQQRAIITLKSTRQNLSGALDIVNEILREPSFSDDEFNTLKNEKISSLEQERSEPQTIASREFYHIMYPHPKEHIYYQMTIDEEVNATRNTTLKEIRNFYNDFYNGTNAIATFVGDFDDAVAKNKLEKILGNWSAPKAYVRVPNTFADITPQNKEIKTPDKKNAMMMCGMMLKMKDDNPDFPMLKMADFIFGGGFLNSRLATRIRQKEGISYGVGSWLEVGDLEESGSFGSYAIYNPENKTKMEKAWGEELEKLLKNGITENELKEAKKGYIQYRETSRTDDGELARLLNRYLYLNRTMYWDKDIVDKLQKLTTAQINTAIKKYLSKEKMTFVKAGDFK